MPEVDGLAATRRIRQLGGVFETLPICAVTANAFADDIRACREAGMNDFIAKPIRKAHLVDKLAQIAEAILEGRPAAGASPNLVPNDGPVSAQDTPLIDRAVAAELAEAIGDDGLDETLQVFLAETETRLQLLRHLQRGEDRDRIENEAHTLKGASATFGFNQLSKAAADLERRAKAISAKDCAELVNRLDAIFTALRTELGARPLSAA
jgi:CheY-like chemotaxis protein